MRFSIITPSFKQLGHLNRCGVSVAAQAADVTIQHIIQDGGTGPDFDAWAARQSFAECAQEADEGMYDAINRGFAKANGDILAWLNCDEQYLPGALAKVAEYFEKHPKTDIVFGDVIVCDADLTPVCYRRAVRPWRTHIRCCFLPTFSAATFIRRKIIDDGHVLDTRFRAIADAVWIHELLESGYSSAVLSEPLSLFVRTGENLGQTPDSVREAGEWRHRGQLVSRIQAHAHGVIHQMRKFLAGAYFERHVDITYFTSSPPVIRHFTGNLRGKWPQSPA